MKITKREGVVLQALPLMYISVTFLFNPVCGLSDSSSSVVVAGYNMTALAGSTMVLQCVSGRMVWTRDRTKDRQRVVHWDIYRSYRDDAMERMVDMFSAGDQRMYNSYSFGRVSMNPTAFKDGNFSLVIKDVTMNDRGLYSCNLHHVYCHLHETVRVQLNVTKSRRKEQRYWDGQKAVFVVMLGTTVVLPCINRRTVWTDWTNEEEDQQVVHWDRQSLGVSHDRADRLVDLYASGEQRSYGPLFLQRKMNISSQAFTVGDFSLSIKNIQPADQGIYSCHLHHHYCGLHERREFQVTVQPSRIKTEEQALPAIEKDNPKEESPKVITVILPEQKHLFILPLTYLLTTLLLLAVITLIVIAITRRLRAKDVCPPLSTGRSRNSSSEHEMNITEVNVCMREEKRFEYKNNLLKEKIQASTRPKVIDLDEEMQKFSK